MSKKFEFKTIPLIRLIQERCGVSLKQAKDVVDEFLKDDFNLPVFGYTLVEDDRKTGERMLVIRRFLAKEEMEKWVISSPTPGGSFLCREGLFIMGPSSEPSKRELNDFVRDACWDTPQEAHEFFKGWMKGYTHVFEAQRAHFLRVKEEDEKRAAQ